MQEAASFTVVLAGDSGTGKTSLISRMEKDDFVEAAQSALSSSRTPIVVDDVNGKKIRLMVWDTPGSDEYSFLASYQLADAQAILLVYALDDPKSLVSISTEWRVLAETNCSLPCLTILVGNKLDDEESRAVSDDDVDKIATELAAESIFVSAKDGTGVKELCRILAHQLLEKFPTVEKRSMTDAELLRTENRRVMKHHIENADQTCKCILI